jgi:hypothetical protein
MRNGVGLLPTTERTEHTESTKTVVLGDLGGLGGDPCNDGKVAWKLTHHANAD